MSDVTVETAWLSAVEFFHIHHDVVFWLLKEEVVRRSVIIVRYIWCLTNQSSLWVCGPPGAIRTLFETISLALRAGKRTDKESDGPACRYATHYIAKWRVYRAPPRY